MNRYNYLARRKGCKGPSISGVAWGETIKRFEGVVAKRFKEYGYRLDMICIESIVQCEESEVPSFELKLAKKPTLIDLFE